MRRFVASFVLISAVLASGCWVAAIPRFTVIKRPVTTTELTGTWVLSETSLKAMAVDGVIKKAGQEFEILLRADGSCSYRTVLGGRFVRKEGKWSLRYDSSDYYRHRLDFQFESEAVSRMSIASDSEGLVLWESWGDPDEGIDLVYRLRKVADTDSGLDQKGF
jgi:hypothetical protein